MPVPEIPGGGDPIPESGTPPGENLYNDANIVQEEATAAASRDEATRASDEQTKQQKASRYRGFFKSTDPSDAPRASEAPATPEASEPEGILSNDSEPASGSNDRGFILVGDTGPKEMVVAGPKEMVVAGPDSSFDPDETIVIEESDPASSTGPTSEFVMGEPVSNDRASDKAPDSGPIEVDGQFDELDPNRETRIRDTVSTSVNGARESGGEVPAKDIVDNEYKIEIEKIRAQASTQASEQHAGVEAYKSDQAANTALEVADRQNEGIHYQADQQAGVEAYKSDQDANTRLEVADKKLQGERELIKYKQELLNKMFMPMIAAQLATSTLGAFGNTKTQQAGMDREVSMALLRALG